MKIARRGFIVGLISLFFVRKPLVDESNFLEHEEMIDPDVPTIYIHWVPFTDGFEWKRIAINYTEAINVARNKKWNPKSSWREWLGTERKGDAVLFAKLGFREDEVLSGLRGE